jgi:hypothetical protein
MKTSCRNSCEPFAIASATHSCGKLALDERKRLRTVLVNVLLVSVGIVAIAAVRVRGIAV